MPSVPGRGENETGLPTGGLICSGFSYSDYTFDACLLLSHARHQYVQESQGCFQSLHSGILCIDTFFKSRIHILEAVCHMFASAPTTCTQQPIKTLHMLDLCCHEVLC